MKGFGRKLGRKKEFCEGCTGCDVTEKGPRNGGLTAGGKASFEGECHMAGEM
jgi:hypothetical protein